MKCVRNTVPDLSLLLPPLHRRVLHPAYVVATRNDLCSCRGSQKPAKTARVLPGVSVLINKLISGGAGEGDKNGRFGKAAESGVRDKSDDGSN